MANPDDKAPEDDQASDEDKNTWPHVDRRKGPRDRRQNIDRRDGDRVVTEEKPRRQQPDRRKN